MLAISRLERDGTYDARYGGCKPPMSSDAGYSSRSWRANGSNPAPDDREANTPDSVIEVPPENAGRRPDLPTVRERLEGMYEKYPDRLLRPVSETHSRKLRLDALEKPEVVRKEYETGEFETEVTFETARRDAKSWLKTVSNFLYDFEEYRDMKLRMSRGDERRGDYESFKIDLYNSFHTKYQKQQYAKLKGLKRMTTGEEPEDSPTGERYCGEFAEPVCVLFAFTASSTPDNYYPNEDSLRFRPVVDHDREIRDAWSGSSNSVKRTLRYLLEEKAGLSSDDYVWWWQSEPHTGEGDAAGFSHSHPIVILDNAETDADAPDMFDSETYRPVVAKHVEVCETAKWSAHRITDGEKSSVKVSSGDEIEDVAAYISEYIQVNTEDDLLERSDEYIMWAAAQWASSTQKYSKNQTATDAITADRCHQEYRDSDAHQHHDHGERVTRSDRRGKEYECNECGSTWQIDQSPETLAECNLSADGGLSVEDEKATGAARDGGVVSFDYDTVELVETDEEATGDTRENGVSDGELSFAELWRDARSGSRVGHTGVVRECSHPPESNTCPLCCAEGETVAAETPIPTSATAHTPESEVTGFERAPEWRPESIVKEWSGEETDIGKPSGVSYGEVVVDGHGAIPPEKCIPPRLLEGPEPWKGENGITEREVRSGEYPPPEVIIEQLSEVARGKRVTPKTWLDDWYARRFETGVEPDASALKDKTREVDDKPAVVKEVENSLGEPLDRAERLVVERIEMVEGAHPDKDVIGLAAKYDAIEHMDIVKATLECVR